MCLVGIICRVCASHGAGADQQWGFEIVSEDVPVCSRSQAQTLEHGADLVYGQLLPANGSSMAHCWGCGRPHLGCRVRAAASRDLAHTTCRTGVVYLWSCWCLYCCQNGARCRDVVVVVQASRIQSLRVLPVPLPLPTTFQPRQRHVCPPQSPLSHPP